LPAPLKVQLSEEEDNQLLQLKHKREIPQRVRERAEMVRLNSHGLSVAQIGKYMKKSPHTVRASIHRYSQQGLEGLWEAPGRGRKPGWTLADLEFLEHCLKSEPRTYNTQQLAEKLALLNAKMIRGLRVFFDTLGSEVTIELNISACSLTLSNTTSCDVIVPSNGASEYFHSPLSSCTFYK
jgi:transposase